MKKLVLLLAAFLTSTALMAQNFPYEKASQQELEMKGYDKDTSANALVLNEFGKSTINETNRSDIRLTFEYHVKIKIFNHKGFDNGTVELELRNNENDNLSDELQDISGMTSYKDDNGAIQAIDLDQKSIYKTRVNKYWTVVKFAMPGLRDGCVIDFRYIIMTPFFDHFRNWQFQTYIPKLHTEYEAHIPGFWTYKISLRGQLKLSKDVAEVEHGCFSVHISSSDCLKLDYGMNDVPAFVDEEYMTTPKNYLSILNFDLEEYTNPYNGLKTRITKEWKDIDNLLKDDPEFGGQLRKAGTVKDHIPPAILNISDNTQKAKAVYRWVQAWFKWNNFVGIYSNDGVKKAIEAHAGSIADINITLIDALNAAGINTEAVLLSTRDHGLISRLYPVMGSFNYIVAKANIDNNAYFLDATDPILPFGTLPEKCLNDQGRVFSFEKPSYWTDLNTNQRKRTITTYDLTLQEDGKLKGTLTRYAIGYDAFLKRKEIKGFNSTDEYIENYNNRLPHLKIIKSTILNVDSLDLPVSEEYEIEIDTKNTSHEHIVMNPYLLHKLTVNPFKLAERNFPVDMGMASDDRFILHLHVPEQYKLDGKPQTHEVSLADKDAVYTTSFDNNNNYIIFSSDIQFNKIIYKPGEYPYLKEFYNKIILAEKSDITISKK